jgi:hypothetical protein
MPRGFGGYAISAHARADCFAHPTRTERIAMGNNFDIYSEFRLL